MQTLPITLGSSTLTLIEPHAIESVRLLPAARRSLAALPLLTAMLISACGGDGGGSSPTPTITTTTSTSTTTTTTQPIPNPLAPAQLQGRWISASSISPAQTAVVLPTSGGGTELWLLASDFSSLSRLLVSSSGTDTFSATGIAYTLPSKAEKPAQSANINGTANLSNNTMSLNSGALLLTRSDEMKSPAIQAAIAGPWSGSVGGQSVTLTWNISANGTLSGPSSTGCSYSGNITARSDAAAYNVSISETCANVIVGFSGIATYRPAQGSTGDAITLALTSTDANQSKALVVSLQ